MSGPALSALTISDPPEIWRMLGFYVDAQCTCQVGGVQIRFGAAAAEGSGITGWTVTGLPDPLPRALGRELVGEIGPPATDISHAPPAAHPNGATAIDHVVLATPDFNRTAAVLAEAGMPLRRIREGDGFRQGFRRLGPVILELVQAGGEPGPGTARFWGLTFTVPDLAALAERLGERLGPVRPAVQPGRQIAAVSRAAGLSTAVAFITPELA